MGINNLGPLSASEEAQLIEATNAMFAKIDAEAIAEQGSAAASQHPAPNSDEKINH